jgi:hypothetical protein
MSHKKNKRLRTISKPKPTHALTPAPAAQAPQAAPAPQTPKVPQAPQAPQPSHTSGAPIGQPAPSTVLSALTGALDAAQELCISRLEAKLSITRLLGVIREIRELIKVMSVYEA